MKLHGQFDTKLIENDMRKHMELIEFSDFIENELVNRDNQEIVGYIDGPPTMNGEPHVGHLRGRIIKDLWFRYNTLKQKRVVFRPGWDTQGLPVELQAEKELGLTGNKTDNINKVGIEKIVDTCKSIVRKYNEKWVSVDKLLNMSFDYGEEYWTFHDKYIEREWSYLKKAWNSGILQEGFRVVAFCPSCQTSLSNAEVNQGYAMVEDPSFYYKVKLVDHDNVYFIVWTTMPFTLITDELIGVNPEENYVHIRTNNNDIWIVGETRLTDLMNELHIDNYQIVKKTKGKDLDGKYYIHPLLDFIPALKDLATSKSIHFVVAEEFVETTTGSGIVHLSPANGEEDFNIAKKRNIPIFVPIDDRVIFTEQAGHFQGLFVRDSDQQIINIMNETGSTVKVGKIKHQYPTCWRSQHKLVWLARREYFYMIEELGDKPLEAAGNVNYFFEPPKNRFIEIIKEKVPWCISRERVWGTPLPIWICTNCGRKDLISNIMELVKQSTNLYLDDKGKVSFKSKKNTDSTNSSIKHTEHFELHRPWIDEVNIECSQCHSTMIREQFVLDTWHNSGAAPFASLTDTEYNKLIPASFLTEGIDQTRGWSYSLLMQNVILNQNSTSPFKSFLFQGHVLDEKGNKMSKSAGNVIDAKQLLENNSVDLVRFYFMWKSSPIEALNFSLKELSSRPYQILSTLYYLHVYLQQNSELDNFNRNIHTIDWAKKNNLLDVPEKWILSLLQNLILQVNSSFENCRFHEGLKTIEDFIINDISQTYVPLTRSYIWNDSSDEIDRRLAIFTVLDHILEKIDILLHPVSPFVTEYLYLNCFVHNGNKLKKDEPSKSSSILLCSWPVAENNLINKDLEDEFEKMKTVISLANSARMKAKIKRRWPVPEIVISYFSDNITSMQNSNPPKLFNDDMSDILKNQLNVEKYEVKQLFASSEIDKILAMVQAKLPIVPLVNLQKKSIAPKVKSDIGKVIQEFENLDKIELLKTLKSSNKFQFKYDKESPSSLVDISEEDLELSFLVLDGFVYSERDNFMVFISSQRDQTLITKGMLRDLARNLQQLRKTKSYNPTEILSTAYVARLDKDEISDLSKFKEELTFLVRVKSVELTKEKISGVDYNDIEIDGRALSISVN